MLNYLRVVNCKQLYIFWTTCDYSSLEFQDEGVPQNMTPNEIIAFISVKSVEDNNTLAFNV